MRYQQHRSTRGPAAVLLLLLVGRTVASSPQKAAHAAGSALDGMELPQGAHRRLQRASIIAPLVAGSITANLPISPLSSVTAPFTLPLMFGGQPGTPSPASPKRYYKMSCDNPRPTFVIVPGARVAARHRVWLRDGLGQAAQWLQLLARHC